MICKSCKNDFDPICRNGVLLSKFCLTCLSRKGKEKIRKQQQKETKELKESLKTHSEWLKDLQKVFNAYIRERDKNKGCITCGKPLIVKFDAGHFFSVGAYPNLRFNENNVHGQCVSCNQHKHGATNEYAIRLPDRIGLESYNELLAMRNESSKLTVSEIKGKISEYKNKIKSL